MLNVELVPSSTSITLPLSLQTLLYSLEALTNLNDSFRMLTRHFRVLVGSFGCGGGYGNYIKKIL